MLDSKTGGLLTVYTGHRQELLTLPHVIGWLPYVLPDPNTLHIKMEFVGILDSEPDSCQEKM